MEPRHVVRVSILVSFGALALALAAWLIGFGLGGTSGSPFGPLVVLGGLVLLAAGFLLVGGAGVDAVWARLGRLREGRRR